MKKNQVKRGGAQKSEKNKITSYFAKFKLPPVKKQTSTFTDDEDVIEDSPQKFFPTKKPAAVLEDVTNMGSTGNQKKRKCLSDSFDGDFEIEQPLKKKQAEEKKSSEAGRSALGKSAALGNEEFEVLDMHIGKLEKFESVNSRVDFNKVENGIDMNNENFIKQESQNGIIEENGKLSKIEKAYDFLFKTSLLDEKDEFCETNEKLDKKINHEEKSLNECSIKEEPLEEKQRHAKENQINELLTWKGNLVNKDLIKNETVQENLQSEKINSTGNSRNNQHRNENSEENKLLIKKEDLNEISQSKEEMIKNNKQLNAEIDFLEDLETESLSKKQYSERNSCTSVCNNKAQDSKFFNNKGNSSKSHMNKNENSPEKSNEYHNKQFKTPDKSNGCLTQNLGVWTPSPGKNLSPSKNGCTLSSSSERGTKKKTPAKRTPKKLFEMSPNVSEFKVEVLNNFIKITPSKKELNKEVVPRKTPAKSSEKKQGSILQFASPCTPRRSLQAQFSNEKTPDHKATRNSQTPSSRVKMKLDFASSPERTITVLDSNKDVKSKHLDLCEVEEVGDDFFDDSWEEEFHFTPTYTLDLSKSQHCKVLDIKAEQFWKIITVQSTKSEDKAVCRLNDFWAEARLDVGCTVHITAIQADSSQEWIVDNNNGLLVYEPDYLVSSTSVVGALFCKRKSVLKDRYAGFDPSNRVMLVGTLVHELLQTCLRNKTQHPKEIMKLINNLLDSRSIVFELYECGISRSEIEQEMKTFVPRIITFMEHYFKVNLGSYPSTSVDKNNWKGRIDSIQDIEENFWCPELGIKGKVDVSIKSQGSVMPLELKTGRASMSLEHRGQIVLYIMMMNKFGYKVPSGLLLYLREGVIRDIPMNEREKRDLIILRNDLTYYLTRKPIIIESESEPANNRSKEKSDLLPGEIPPPINHHSACGRCEYNTICCAYLKKEGLGEFQNLNKVSEEVASHLKEIHVDYFMHWSSLISMENNVAEGKSVRDIYLKPPEEREKNGKCIINTVVTNCVQGTGSGFYSTTFCKRGPGFCNLLTSGFGEGSYLVVSRNDRPAVATGLVTHIDHSSITLELDRDLSKKYPDATFHLDGYDSGGSNTFNFTSLALLLDDTERADKLRKIVIEKEKPTFRKTLPSEVGKKSGPILKMMNKMQQKAVIKALAANDYLLIKGMPGTGKTATIVALIQFLVELNYSVLLTSHTHSAVDNVCVRLQDCGIDVLRLGSDTRIHSKLKHRSEGALTQNCNTPEDLEAVYNSAKVLAVTCYGSKHPVLSKRTMDVCIVDESTQVLQPSVFRPLYASKKFILIGDPDQLPPIVKNREALARGLSQSLFERLQSPESVVMLTYNYRMNKTITALANDLTYNGELLIANDTVANATVRFTKFESLSSMYRDKQWILEALNHDLKKSVCILDTGPVWNKNYKAAWIHKSGIEKVNGEVVMGCINPCEVAVVFHLVNALIKGGITPSCIGVIAPYRAQIAQLSAVLEGTGVEVNTVDQFQGQDKEVVLYSCTKSKDLSKEWKISKFEILEDKRRLTVAITRAKHKFMMIADVATIRQYSPFCKLLSCISSEHCMKLIDGVLGFNMDKLIEHCGGVN